MAKKKAADPVSVALNQILGIYDALTREQQEELENRLWATQGLFDGIKFHGWCDEIVTHGHIVDLTHRLKRRKKSQSIAERDKMLAAEHDEAGRSYAVLAKAHKMNKQTVISAVGRGRVTIKNSHVTIKKKHIDKS